MDLYKRVGYSNDASAAGTKMIERDDRRRVFFGARGHGPGRCVHIPSDVQRARLWHGGPLRIWRACW
jgi:hypothetical protein